MDRLLEYFTPEKYQLNLTIDRQTEQISGHVTISGIALAKVIKFHAVGLDIKNVETSKNPLTFRHEYDILEVDVPDFSGAGLPIVLKIAYSTKLNRNMQACYLSTYQFEGREERIAATQFESHYAREAFPCIDEPAAKAVFELALTVPDFREGVDVVLANTELVDTAGCFTFAPTPRMSTYLLAWVIGAFNHIETDQNGLKVATYIPLNQDPRALEFPNTTAARAIEYYNQRFGVPYPLKKLDQVAIPDFEAGAMENWGLVTYRESMLLATPDSAVDTKQSVALTITHELSHQWFGDLVTMKWWDDLWLNESFASVIEYYCTDALYPEFHAWEDFFASSCLAALRRDALPGVQAVRQNVSSPAEIATLFDGAIVYAKGARLILMLIHLMGEENFDKGLRDYFKKFKYGNTVGADLWAALQPYAEFDVAEFMNVWISQPGYPALQKGGDGHYYQQRFLLDGTTDDSKWPLPEIFDDMSGHYLLDLGDKEFQEKLANFAELSLEQKLRLLLDRELLARTPAVPSASLIDLLEAFRDEHSAAVWEILGLIVGDLKLFCPPHTPEYDAYRAFLNKLFSDEFASLDFGPTDDVEAKRFRASLTGVALYTGHPKTMERLRAFYTDDFAGIDPEIRTAVLIAELRSDEAKYFPLYLEKYQQTADPELKSELLYIIAGFCEQQASVARALELLGQPEIVRPGDHIFLFAYLMRNPSARGQALDWLTAHWEYLEQLTGDKSIEDYPRYAASTIRTEPEAKQFYDFFDPKAEIPVLARTIKMAHTEIDTRLSLITSDGPAFREKIIKKS